jgi:hypothetical protein
MATVTPPTAPVNTDEGACLLLGIRADDGLADPEVRRLGPFWQVVFEGPGGGPVVLYDGDGREAQNVWARACRWQCPGGALSLVAPSGTILASRRLR